MKITTEQLAIYNKRISEGESQEQAAFAALYWTTYQGFVPQSTIEEFLRSLK